MPHSTELVEIIGFIAGAITTFSFLPQLVAVYRQKSAKDLSWIYLATFTTGVALWLVYGLMLSALPIIAANAVTLTLLAAIMTLKVKYHH
jgi:MtN3 and saliva related transmembrane protein